METLIFNKNKYDVPNRWEELSQKQFLQILDEIKNLFAGKLGVFEFRIMVALIVMGIKPRRIRSAEKQLLQSENVYRISCALPFPLRIEYAAEKSFNKFPNEVQEQLTRFLPEELNQSTPHFRWAAKAKKAMVPDFIFAANLVPVISDFRHNLTGYKFSLTDKILSTSLTADQYTEAQTAYNRYIAEGSESMLNLLVAILYLTPQYNGEYALQLSQSLKWIKPEVKNAVFVNFQAIQQFLTTRTKYSVLFNAKTKKKSTGSQPGLESVIFSLIKSGVAAPGNMNLVQFFELMYNDLVSSVQSLHKQETPLDKIAYQTGLSINTINQLI